MALDFGDAGLFDPIPPANNKHKAKEDDENENVQAGNGGWKEDEDKEIPEDVDDVDDEFEDWPTAPPLDILDCIKGYEMVSFDAMSVPPPPFEEVVEAPSTEEKPGQEKDSGDGANDEEIKSKVSLSWCASH